MGLLSHPATCKYLPEILEVQGRVPAAFSSSGGSWPSLVLGWSRISPVSASVITRPSLCLCGHSCPYKDTRHWIQGPPYSSMTPSDLLHLQRPCFLFFFFFFGPHYEACGILVLQPGMEPAPPAVEARSPNHWTTREVPRPCFQVRSHCEFLGG